MVALRANVWMYGSLRLHVWMYYVWMYGLEEDVEGVDACDADVADGAYLVG